MTGHPALPWKDPDEHDLTGYGDINHVIIDADGKTVGSLYANCFNVEHLRMLPSVEEARANATLLFEAINSHASLKARIKELETALRTIRDYNADIIAGRINYRPYDHIRIIDIALNPTTTQPLNHRRNEA